ncbi:MAG: penicillin-binding protein 2 [Oscillospiraceae bacterium]|nr:penicillin-binding protein 2 [Oscillospiraceae bacterium]
MKKRICLHREASGRLWTLRLVMTVFCSWLITGLAGNAASTEYRAAGEMQGTFTVKLPVSFGTIYDRNGIPLVNAESRKYAVLSGNADQAERVMPFAADKKEFAEKAAEGVPFICELTENSSEIHDDVTVIDVPVRYDKEGTAEHIIGYIQDGHGVCGLELDYDEILRRDNGQTKVTFSVDGTGRAFSGEEAVVQYAPRSSQGVVTTIDAGIQKICEKASCSLKKGAVVVMNVNSGDILGLVSRPAYSLDDMESALSSEDSPLINHALCAYPVGSIFKLVTTAAAIETGNEDFAYECTGSIDVGTQHFSCHKKEGHGSLALDTALIGSCNPYFIALSERISALEMFETAARFGFGSEIGLSDSIFGRKGYLPDVQELMLPAEKGNFSFGQGKLTASPLQITRMTSAIANGGFLPEARLVIGETEDGSAENTVNFSTGKRVIQKETSDELRKMMIGVVYGGSNFKGKPEGVCAGAKTSTAQTGRYNENGEEYCHGWVTGFFPAHDPEFAVTVLAEDAGYGNDSAAPVFKEIAEGMREYARKSQQK